MTRNQRDNENIEERRAPSSSFQIKDYVQYIVFLFPLVGAYYDHDKRLTATEDANKDAEKKIEMLISKLETTQNTAERLTFVTDVLERTLEDIKADLRKRH